ncbi:hypothetical protein [Archangium lipolyticum]|uniref:hypothetical protein n=1 Tax=Archangium lipolyticum TaxID=2970465 RepID=UPI00214A66F1|nr:hypothetical protein [Archangium lipolyticum]
MPRLPRLLFLVLLAVSGCGSLRGCGASEETLDPAASAPDASTPSVATPPPEARYSRSWLVIIHSSATPGEGTGALEALKKTGLPAEPDRLSSNAFRNLRPCLEVVVAKAFTDKAGAEEYRKQLSEAGLEAYVKNAGPLDPDREEKAATCLSEAQAAAARAEAREQGAVPRFVEVHDGRTFMLLGAAEDQTGLSPVDERRSLWMAPVEADPTGFFTKGDDVDLYGAAGPVQAGCKVSGFARINRGRPHFGYFQQQPPPDAPGCGRAWTFAELDCAMTPSDVVFALPAGTKAPVFYAAGNEASPEVLAAQEDALRRSAGFATLLAEGRLRAEQVQEELNEDVRGFGFSSDGRHVVFMMVRLITGEGNAECGGDYNEQLTRAVVVGPGGEERVLSVKDLDGGRVAGVMDLEGDGQVELLLHDSWPAQTARVIREDGSEVAGAVVENCDCGC